VPKATLLIPGAQKPMTQNLHRRIVDQFTFSAFNTRSSFPSTYSNNAPPALEILSTSSEIPNFFYRFNRIHAPGQGKSCRLPHRFSHHLRALEEVLEFEDSHGAVPDHGAGVPDGIDRHAGRYSRQVSHLGTRSSHINSHLMAVLLQKIYQI